jgi:hypothetical protein
LEDLQINDSAIDDAERLLSHSRVRTKYEKSTIAYFWLFEVRIGAKGLASCGGSGESVVSVDEVGRPEFLSRTAPIVHRQKSRVRRLGQGGMEKEGGVGERKEGVRKRNEGERKKKEKEEDRL